MATSTQAAFRFAFKDSIQSLKENRKKESILMMHCSYRGEKFKISTGYKSCYDDWNFEKQRIKTNKAGILDSYNINTYLDKLEKKGRKIFNQLKAEGEGVNINIIKSKLKQDEHSALLQEEKVSYNLIEYFERFISLKQPFISEITLRSYKQTIRLVKDFRTTNMSELDFDKIDMVFYNQFVSFLEEKDFSLNTIGKHIKNLKAILNKARIEGFNHFNKYEDSDFRAPTEQTTAVFLSEEELDSLQQLDLSSKPSYELARDIFLIGCYIGQRVSDYNGLTKEDIVDIDGMPHFHIIQRKTKTEVYCPIPSKVKIIMERYNGCPPPKMSEQYINRYIKKACKLAGVTNEIKCKFTKGGELQLEFVAKYQLIGTHTARRSFCTNKYKENKLSTFDIMFYSGHKTEKEFYKYIRISNMERAKHLAKQYGID